DKLCHWVNGLQMPSSGICACFLKVSSHDAYSESFWAVDMQNEHCRLSSPTEHQLFDIHLNTPFAAFKTSRCSQCLCQVSIWDLIIVVKNDDSVIFFSLMGSPCQHCSLKM
ncbi:hypothetical protein ILYODFUR_020496, partial [Ilyodon furcidens]